MDKKSQPFIPKKKNEEEQKTQPTDSYKSTDTQYQPQVQFQSFYCQNLYIPLAQSQETPVFSDSQRLGQTTYVDQHLVTHTPQISAQDQQYHLQYHQSLQLPQEKEVKKPFGGPQLSKTANIKLITNNFKISSQKEGLIYTYLIEVFPQTSNSKIMDLDCGSELFVRTKLLASIHQKLKLTFFRFIVTGNTLFSSAYIENDLQYEASQQGVLYRICIKLNSEFSLDELTLSKMQAHPMALNFINNIIKSAMKSAGLRQLGRKNAFFDHQRAKSMGKVVQALPGYFTSAWLFEKGLYLTIENLSKFISTQSCLDVINENWYRGQTKQQITAEFQNCIILSQYGTFKTYKINTIRWELTPLTYYFKHEDKKVSMLQYFVNMYNIKITDVEQPLLEIKFKKQNILLPPQFCVLVGLPSSIRQDLKVMRDLRSQQYAPLTQRISDITQLSSIISTSKEAQEWNMSLQSNVEEVSAKILPQPLVIAPNNKTCKAITSQNWQKAISEPTNLNGWFIICLKRDTGAADILENELYKISQTQNLKISVEYANKIVLGDKAVVKDFETSILKLKQQSKHDGNVLVVIIIPSQKLQNEEMFYNQLKNTLNGDKSNRFISQFVKPHTIMKNKQNIFSNILRQINVKLGGDLWRMQCQQWVPEGTMVVGIDVCHKGKTSAIGFVASYDVFFCKYFTQADPQPKKGRELIAAPILEQYFRSALECYQTKNSVLPKHICIYRDGVGDGMRQQVLDSELSQLTKILAELYPLDYLPSITLVVANKRIHQQFFQEKNIKNTQEIVNPQQGTYIDEEFVEESDGKNSTFDFYLIPHNVTQGAVQPTHFYVIHNTANLTKEAIINFTYALCFNYPNWMGAIKVPAPCKLADKVAYYLSEVGNIPCNKELYKFLFYI